MRFLFFFLPLSPYFPPLFFCQCLHSIDFWFCWIHSSLSTCWQQCWLHWSGILCFSCDSQTVTFFFLFFLFFFFNFSFFWPGTLTCTILLPFLGRTRLDQGLLHLHSNEQEKSSHMFCSHYLSRYASQDSERARFEAERARQEYDAKLKAMEADLKVFFFFFFFVI